MVRHLAQIVQTLRKLLYFCLDTMPGPLLTIFYALFSFKDISLGETLLLLTSFDTYNPNFQTFHFLKVFLIFVDLCLFTKQCNNMHGAVNVKGQLNS